LKETYLDTNVLLSPFHAGDSFASESLRILRTRRIYKVTSPVTLVELCATVSRLRREGTLAFEKQIEESLNRLGPSEQVYALALFFLSFGSVKVIGMDTVAKAPFDDLSFATLLEFMEACRIAPLTLLRSLDNVHIAAVKVMKRQGRTIDYLVTCDKGILGRREELRRTVDVPVLSPAELVETVRV
jgi:predicted nucleic acid-binding protein